MLCLLQHFRNDLVATTVPKNKAYDLKLSPADYFDETFFERFKDCTLDEFKARAAASGSSYIILPVPLEER